MNHKVSLDNKSLLSYNFIHGYTTCVENIEHMFICINVLFQVTQKYPVFSYTRGEKNVGNNM